MDKDYAGKCDETVIYEDFLHNPEPIVKGSDDARYIYNVLGTEKKYNNITYQSKQNTLTVQEPKRRNVYHLNNPKEGQLVLKVIKELGQPERDTYFGPYRLPYKHYKAYEDANLKAEDKKIVGQGGFGTVINMGEYVRKRVPNTDPLYEVSMMIRLHHPNIMNVVDVTHSDVSINIIMLKATSDLFALLSKGGITSNNIDNYVSQVCQGIIYLQKRDIWHCDLKPGNILYFKDTDTLKITDFGLAVSLSCASDAKTYPEKYTPVYRPIEMYMGEYTKNLNGDFYSLGIILTEMVIGRYLFFNQRDPFEWPEDIAVKMFNLLGDPLKYWKNDKKIENFLIINKIKPTDNKLSELLQKEKKMDISPGLENLILKLLAYPNLRYSLEDLINDKYLRSSGYHPCTLKDMTCMDNLLSRELYPSLPPKVDYKSYGTEIKDFRASIFKDIRNSHQNSNVKFLAFYIMDAFFVSEINQGKKLYYQYKKDYMDVALNLATQLRAPYLNRLFSENFDKTMNIMRTSLRYDIDIASCYDFLQIRNKENIDRLFDYVLAGLCFKYLPHELAEHADELTPINIM
jgi:serine/threonine protein kinase